MRASVIDSVVENAAELYRKGAKMPQAVAESLDQFNIRDPREREPLYKQACKILASRGGKVSGRRRKFAAEKRQAQAKPQPPKTVAKVAERLIPVNGTQLSLASPTRVAHPGRAIKPVKRRRRSH